MFDEAASWTFAKMPWHSFWKISWDYEGNMTLYYLALRLWVHLGDSDVVLRSLSVLFGVATIPIVYLLGHRLFNRRVGLIAATLITVHAFHIRWSQQARSYAMVALLISLSTVLLVSALKSPRARGPWACYLLVSTLACYCQVLAVLVVAAQWLWILVNGFSLLRSRITGLLLQAVLLAPCVWYVTFRNKGQLDWVPPLSFERVLHALRSLAGSAIAGPAGTAVAFFLYAGLCSLAVFVGTKRREGSRRAATSLLLLWLLIPLGVITLASAFKPVLVDRFLLMCLPAMLVLASSGIDSLFSWGRTSGWAGALALIAVLSVSCYGTVLQYGVLENSRNDFREMTLYILSNQQPADGAIFFTAAAQRSFRYYAASYGAVRVPTTVIPDFSHAYSGTQTIPSKGEVEAASAPYTRVWLILDMNSIDLEPAWQQAVPRLRQSLEEKFTLEGEQKIGRFFISLYVLRAANNIAPPTFLSEEAAPAAQT